MAKEETLREHENVSNDVMETQPVSFHIKYQLSTSTKVQILLWRPGMSTDFIGHPSDSCWGISVWAWPGSSHTVNECRNYCDVKSLSVLAVIQHVQKGKGVKVILVLHLFKHWLLHRLHFTPHCHLYNCKEVTTADLLLFIIIIKLIHTAYLKTSTKYFKVLFVDDHFILNMQQWKGKLTAWWMTCSTMWQFESKLSLTPPQFCAGRDWKYFQGQRSLWAEAEGKHMVSVLLGNVKVCTSCNEL